MTFDQFITTYLGKKIDFDGSYGGQCVDLYRQYVKDVLNFPQSPGVRGAADIWTTYLKDKFTAITNTPTGVPKKGDIVIWDTDAGGGYGHVAVFISGDTNKFVSFDQNWPTLSVCTKTSHDYSNVIGWLTPKVQTIPEPMPTIPTVSKVLEYYKVKTEDELIKMVDSQLQFLEDARKKVTELESINKDHVSHLEELASKLGTVVDYPAITAEVTHLLSVEEVNRQLERKMDQKEKKCDEERNVLLDEVNQLKNAVKRQQKENETLLKRIDRVEETATHQQEQKVFFDTVRGFIDQLSKVFERKK